MTAMTNPLPAPCRIQEEHAPDAGCVYRSARTENGKRESESSGPSGIRMYGFEGFVGPLFRVYTENMRKGINLVNYDAPLANYFYETPLCRPCRSDCRGNLRDDCR